MEEQKPTFYNNVVKASGTSLLGSAKGIWEGAKGTVDNFGKLIRLGKDKIPKGGEAGKKGAAKASMVSSALDWRVRLSLPEGFDSSPLLYPLEKTKGLVFPYTPMINMVQSASYNTIAPVHNNYPFLAYENSKVEEISITGDFYVEDSSEAEYWVAVVHYLRSVTKMDYGVKGTGAPPPVVKLYGYGEYVFNGAPVVIKSFSMELPKDVDYIATKFTADPGLGEIPPQGISYVPIKSVIQVTCIPLYSRTQVRNFNLSDFVKGTYIFDGSKYL